MEVFKTTKLRPDETRYEQKFTKTSSGNHAIRQCLDVSGSLAGEQKNGQRLLTAALHERRVMARQHADMAIQTSTRI